MEGARPAAGRTGTAEAVEIAVPPGEYWWGGDTADGYRMPFADGSLADLRRPGDNQAMPMLVSSQGRYIWSDRPFTIEYAAAALKVRPQGGSRIEVGAGDASLR